MRRVMLVRFVFVRAILSGLDGAHLILERSLGGGLELDVKRRIDL